MRTIFLVAVQFCAASFLLISMGACGGSQATGSEGSGKEILYASNTDDGIFSFDIDQNTGALTQIAAIAPSGASGIGNYSQLAVTPSGSSVYVIDKFGLEMNGYLTTSSGALSAISGSPFPVGIADSRGIFAFAIDPAGKFLYESTERLITLGSLIVPGIAVLMIDSTSGNLTPIPGEFLAISGGPLQQIAIDPTGRFLYGSSAVDSSVPGENIWGFTIDSGSGALMAMSGSPFATSQNSQPFGLCVDPAGKFLYAALLNAGSVAAFTIDDSTGALTPVPNSPFPTATTPDPQPFQLAMAPSGKVLYAMNNTGTIAAFTIDSSTGALTTVSGSPFPINGGGQLVVDPSGEFLYVDDALSLSTAFTVFDIDQNSGALSPNQICPIAGSQQPRGLG